MSKKKKHNYYAWHSPDGGGIYETWDECNAVCSKIKGEKHKGFAIYAEAWAFAFPDIPFSQKGKDEGGEDCKADILKLRNDDISFFESVPIVNSEVELKDDVNRFCEYYEIVLNDQQKKAVQCVEGRALLFAVPGSGKTTVIIARIGYMIHMRHISPNQIISLTFTKAAANEMRERFEKQFKTEQIPDFRTIHSLCYSIILKRLKREGFSCDRKLMESKKQDKDDGIPTPGMVFRKVFKAIRCTVGDLKTDMEVAQTAITGIKNSCMKPEEYQGKTIKINNKAVNVTELYNHYQKVLDDFGLMDYDDLLIYAYEGLKKNKNVLRDLQKQYKYWSIDEAQDNSKLQSKLLDMICSDDISVFMVGDDDQSIYGFRGANPMLLRLFGRREDVRTLLISHNFRSEYNIVNISRAFIETNKNREDKEMIPYRKDPGQISIPYVLKNEAEQYSLIIKACKEAVSSGRSLAVLFRRNISSFPLIIYLHKVGIPYEASSSLTKLLQERIIRQLWRIFCFIVSQNNWEAFLNARKSLELYISEDDLKVLKDRHKANPSVNILDLLLSFYEESENKKDKAELVNKRKTVLQELCIMKPSDAFKKIREEIYISNAEGLGDRLRLYSFLSVCDIYDTVRDMVQDIHDIINEEKRTSEDEDPTDFLNSLDAIQTNQKPLITLSTIHSSKGREFDWVIMIDLLDEMMPGDFHDDALIYDPEEERRLFYVAITRAKNKLDFFTVDRYHGNSEIISRFVKDVAYLSDFSGIDGITVNDDPNDVVKSSKYLIKPSKYYGVRNGRKPGVYITWKDCKEQIEGYSGQDYRSFSTKEEAEEYVGITSVQEVSQYNLTALEKYFTESGGACFNHPIDLPSPITNRIIEKLTKLSESQISRIRSQSQYMFREGQTTDYRDITDAYVMTYMPANFYKIWKPLWDLALRCELPSKPRVLELGTGPGTATLGMISFYIVLANSNPDIKYSLDITAVEREKSFGKVFNELTSCILECCPNNLSVRRQLIQEDAFSCEIPYLSRYDLVMECNMLNSFENEKRRTREGFIRVAKDALSNNGYVLMIEPGRKENRQDIVQITEEMEQKGVASSIMQPIILSTAISNISLYKKAFELGLRGSLKTEHWFSYTVLKRNGDD